MNSPDLRTWDGIWRVPRPDSYIPGLYRVHQITAHDLLKDQDFWTEAQARMLQAIFYTAGPLSDLQSHYLTRFERMAEGKVAA